LPVADNPEQVLPATVISHDHIGDTQVVVEDASRVLAISMTGPLAELTYAYGLGGTLIGRDVSTNLPGLEDLPVVTGSGHTLDTEGIVALQPTLVLTDNSVGSADVMLQLRDVGIDVVVIERANSPETTYETARQVAAALGVAPLAETLITELDQAITEKVAEIAQLAPADQSLHPRVAFLYIRGQSGVYYLFGDGSSATSLLDGLGVVDVAQEIGWVGEKPMTDEALVAADPDIIVVMTKGLKSTDGVDGLIAAQPSIALTTAGKNRRIIDADDTLIFAGGTRIPDILDGLARAIYAPDSLPDASAS
jgi:iron complex transport system substrate-binding protein